MTPTLGSSRGRFKCESLCPPTWETWPEFQPLGPLPVIAGIWGVTSTWQISLFQSLCLTLSPPVFCLCFSLFPNKWCIIKKKKNYAFCFFCQENRLRFLCFEFWISGNKWVQERGKHTVTLIHERILRLSSLAAWANGYLALHIFLGVGYDLLTVQLWDLN